MEGGMEGEGGREGGLRLHKNLGVFDISIVSASAAPAHHQCQNDLSATQEQRGSNGTSSRFVGTVPK